MAAAACPSKWFWSWSSPAHSVPLRPRLLSNALYQTEADTASALPHCDLVGFYVQE